MGLRQIQLSGSTFLLLLAALASATRGGVVTVDTFSTNQTVVVPAGGTNPARADNGVTSSAILGGARNVMLSRGVGSGSITASNISTPGVLEMLSEPASTASEFMCWDGDTDAFNNTTGLHGIDLTGGGTNDRMFVSYRANVAGVRVYVDVHSSPTTWSRATFLTTATGFGTAPFVGVELPFSSFAVFSGSAASFSSAGSVLLLVDNSAKPGLNLQFDQFDARPRIVPEPVALSFATITLWALTRRNRAA